MCNLGIETDTNFMNNVRNSPELFMEGLFELTTGIVISSVSLMLLILKVKE